MKVCKQRTHYYSLKTLPEPLGGRVESQGEEARREVPLPVQEFAEKARREDVRQARRVGYQEHGGEERLPSVPGHGQRPPGPLLSLRPTVNGARHGGRHLREAG